MTRRTYRYEVSGTVTVDDVDLQASALGIRLITHAPPGSGEAFGEHMEYATQSPEEVVKLMVVRAMVGFVGDLPQGQHAMPAIEVVVEPETE